MKWFCLCGVAVAAWATGVAAAPQDRRLAADAPFEQILAEYRGGDAQRAVDVLAAWD